VLTKIIILLTISQSVYELLSIWIIPKNTNFFSWANINERARFHIALEEIRLILSIMSYHSYDIREIDPYDMGIRSKFQNHSPEIRHDRKNPPIYWIKLVWCVGFFFIY
jgi:hypothetical protein